MRSAAAVNNTAYFKNVYNIIYLYSDVREMEKVNTARAHITLDV